VVRLLVMMLSEIIGVNMNGPGFLIIALPVST